MLSEFNQRIVNYKNASFRVVTFLGFLLAQLSDKKAIQSFKTNTLATLTAEGIVEGTAKAFLTDATTISVNAVGCLDLASFESKLASKGITNTAQAMRFTNADKVIKQTIFNLPKELKQDAMTKGQALLTNLTLPELDSWLKECDAAAKAAAKAAADAAAAAKADADAKAAADAAAKATAKAAADAAAAADAKAAADAAAAAKAAAKAAAAMLDKISNHNNLDDLFSWQAAIDARIAFLTAKAKKSA